MFQGVGLRVLHVFYVFQTYFVYFKCVIRSQPPAVHALHLAPQVQDAPNVNRRRQKWPGRLSLTPRPLGIQPRILGLSWTTPTGVPRSQETASRWDPTVGLCLGPYGGPRGWAFSYERVIPVGAGKHLGLS